MNRYPKTAKAAAMAHKRIVEAGWNGNHECAYPWCDSASERHNMCNKHAMLWYNRGPMPSMVWWSMCEDQKQGWVNLWDVAKKLYREELRDELAFHTAHGSKATPEYLQKLRERILHERYVRPLYKVTQGGGA